MTSSRRRARGLGAAALTAAVATATLAAPALAAPSGNTTIALKGPAARALRSQQVAISAKKPARAGAKRIVLPVHGATVNKNAARLTHRGAVTLRAKHGKRTRTVTLTAWRTQVGKKRSTISAKVGAKRVTLFTVAAPQRRVTLNATAGTARVTGATARLTPAGAKALRARLALRTLPAAQLGSAKVAAKTGKTSGRSNTPGTGGGTPNPGTGGGGTTPPPQQCGGFDSGRAPEASAPLARPATTTVRDVADAPMWWYVRDSWIRYMNTPDNGIRPADGAVLGPVESYPEPTESYRDPAESPRFAYSVRFAFNPAGSWYDPATNTGRFAYTGSIRFVWTSHFIDLTFKDPEIELNGDSSRMVFTVIGAACSNVPAKRIELLKLAPQQPTGEAPYAFPSMAATITEPGGILFSGQYFAGNPWGSVKSLAVTLAP
ncbi:HtaA domain-containing protein [Conexibacter arvalis]|uniref:Htaa domain-containing protein n=1 Tax=Conexibacter arvalis TaxID=912552 RepID=A0A840II00_9ACTN|nr:HtaA domain-containing protein [Conexibacter arvalis]MBB4663590.1 hypothetical protein [Conexibacter arvalis]